MKNHQNKTLILLSSIIIILIIGYGVYAYTNTQQLSSTGVATSTESVPANTYGQSQYTDTHPTPTTDGAPVVGAGDHCGGFIQNAPVCSTGFYCQLTGSRPDTGGTCVADKAAGAGGGGILPFKSGIRGTVMLGPSCPVMRNPPDPQCTDKPYQTSVSVSHSSSPTKVFATAESASDGTFKLSLPPGDYIVSAGGNKSLPRCSNVSATVESSGYIEVQISCDTGIR